MSTRDPSFRTCSPMKGSPSIFRHAMAPLLRRRLTCFYCGCRSSQKYADDLRRWECTTCEAVNYLDENGEITDPPPFETTSDVRYAQSIQRPESPVFTTPDEALFCPTCIKNQHLLTQSLAAYLPSPIDPNYATYEASYPGYRKGLEERYPQVCEDCEPRVRERIRATGYAAKTDHLRRMMEKSRGASRSQSRWDWRRFVVLMGAIMWWTSLAGQMQWNLIGAVATGSELDGLREFNASTSLPDCLWQSLQTGEAKHECVELAGSLTGLAVILGLLSIWWNPCLSAKIKGKGGRMVGLSAFYNFQAVGNGLRLVQWYLLGHSTDLRLNGQITKALHAFMLVFNTLALLISYRSVRMDYTSRVSFQESHEPLINRARTQVPINAPRGTPPPSNTNSFSTETQSYRASFPISNLAPPPQQTYPPPYNPPTPPPDEDELDTMDWTPTQQPFRPVASAHTLQPTPTRVQPSPFYGRLPPAPMSQAHQLRNPANQSTFRRTSAVQRRNFFKRMTNRESATGDDDSEYQDSEYDPDYDRVTNSPMSPASHRSGMAPPKFFPQSDYHTDTGLESIFNAAFSLGDEPMEVRAAREGCEGQIVEHGYHSATRAKWQRIVSILLLLLACLAWSFSSTHATMALSLRLGALGIAATVAGIELLEAMQVDKAYWRLSDILVFAVELAFAVILGTAVNSSSKLTAYTDDSLGTGPMWLLGGMVIQEMLMFAHQLRDLQMSSSGFTSRNMQAGDMASSRGPAAPSYPLAGEGSLADAHQREARRPVADSTDQALELHQPRVTRSKSKRESFVPSNSLSGLSLGLGRDSNHALTNAKHASWGGGRDAMSRTTRSKLTA